MSLSSRAHRVLNALGLEVRLLKNLRRARELELKAREFDSWRLLANRKFRTVLDIGANEGQFARIARELWPAAMIHSFEPLPRVFSSLVSQFEADPSFRGHNIALSDRSGSQNMHCSAFSPSSSLLKMAEVHRIEWPESASHTDVEVAVVRLDDWAVEQGPLELPILVKIDVQGFELHVIEGGRQTLSRADVVVLEASFHEFYEGQPLFADVHARMCELGFTYRGNIEQFVSREKSCVLYADAIFEKAACAASPRA